MVHIWSTSLWQDLQFDPNSTFLSALIMELSLFLCSRLPSWGPSWIFRFSQVCQSGMRRIMNTWAIKYHKRQKNVRWTPMQCSSNCCRTITYTTRLRKRFTLLQSDGWINQFMGVWVNEFVVICSLLVWFTKSGAFFFLLEDGKFAIVFYVDCLCLLK